MVKNSIVVLVSVGMLVAITSAVAASQRVANSRSIRSPFNCNLATKCGPFPFKCRRRRGRNKKQIFRLIDSHEYTEPETGPFHPEWTA